MEHQKVGKLPAQTGDKRKKLYVLCASSSAVSDKLVGLPSVRTFCGPGLDSQCIDETHIMKRGWIDTEDLVPCFGGIPYNIRVSGKALCK